MDDLWSLRRVGVVEGVFHQASLTTIQVLHSLLTNHDFLGGKKIKSIHVHMHVQVRANNVHLLQYKSSGEPPNLWDRGQGLGRNQLGQGII